MAEKREIASRSIFAQHAIKAQEIETDLKEVDDAMWAGEGDADAIIEKRGLRQLSDTGAIGGSIYDWRTMEPAARDRMSELMRNDAGN